MADGAVIRTGGRNVKDVAGYSLTHLFVGSQGTLAITTEATLRLRPAPPPRSTMLAFFPTLDAAGEAVAGIAAAGLSPVTLELLDRFTIAAVDDMNNLGPRSDGRRDADGRVGHARRRRDRRARARGGRLPGGRARPTSSGPPTRRRPTGCARRGGPPTTRSSGSATCGWRTSACRGRACRTCSARSSAIAAKHDVRIGTFGHAGDGNLHPDLVFDRGDPQAEAKTERGQDRPVPGRARRSAARSPASTASASARREWLEIQRGADAVRVMRAIKTALDPLGILNPGRVV